MQLCFPCGKKEMIEADDGDVVPKVLPVPLVPTAPVVPYNPTTFYGRTAHDCGGRPRVHGTARTTGPAVHGHGCAADWGHARGHAADRVVVPLMIGNDCFFRKKQTSLNWLSCRLSEEMYKDSEKT